MNKTIIIVIFLFGLNGFSQSKSELEVKQTILSFFDGFHKQDSLAIKPHVSESVILQTIGNNAEGMPSVKTVGFGNFLKSITSIPKNQKFEEKLLGFNIQVDGPMAHAWTPYEFWFDGKFSHCGVNSFQLFNENGKWKIVYLIDTRRKIGCETND
ncbi:nuclear transport factor 2 family protein [Geojedonia litorea]|uniref:Nuclear transport factor 2 family protein n=1 Tax=Geojedonia litorea TaxID=1268269 RepID=A0ABV9N182_9FLAO